MTTPDAYTRMRGMHHHARACLAVGVDATAPEAWGWRGRTLGLPVLTSAGQPAWLRLACAVRGAVAETFWDGALAAEDAIPVSVPRPRLLAHHDFTDQRWVYRAELYERVDGFQITAGPVLAAEPGLPDSWWAELSAAVEDVGRVRTRRFTTQQRYLDRAMPRFLGSPISTTAPSWTTAHGDLHWANLYGPDLQIGDWEGWGRAPTGYDAAVLHTHSLLVPRTAARIRDTFPVLDTAEGRFAELAVITQTLDATTRGDHLHLADALRDRAARLLERSLPALEAVTSAR
ncbi:hypothetical protein ACFW17_21970 [Streptomyces sp. NPDC058961]|uniref:hypothetical protein n=1 Tax=Streptomyces sp. NPDC058961 TaxID=3346680 RepID=UPI0036D0714B